MEGDNKKQKSIQEARAGQGRTGRSGSTEAWKLGGAYMQVTRQTSRTTRDMVDLRDKEQEQGDSMNRARVWKGCSRKELQA